MFLNYVMLGSNDVETARGFYDAVLFAIGGKLTAEYMPHAFCYELRGGARVWVAAPFNEETAVSGNGNMVGFACESAAHSCSSVPSQIPMANERRELHSLKGTT